MSGRNMLLTSGAICNQDAAMLSDADWILIRAAAKKRGISRHTAKAWKRPDRQIPAQRVPGLAEDTGIPPHKMRPDVFRQPSRAA